MMLLKLVDELVISLMRIICTTDVDAGVRYARKDERVGHLSLIHILTGDRVARPNLNYL